MTVFAGGTITQQNYVDEVNNRMRVSANNKTNATAQQANDTPGGTSAIFPAAAISTGIATLPGGSVSGPALEAYLRAYATEFSRVRRVRFNTPTCGTSFFRYVRIANQTPSPTVTGPAGLYSNIQTNDPVSAGNFISLVTNIVNQVQKVNYEELHATVTECHCSCHSSCHSSRGRR